MALNDEVYEIRELAICMIGRLSSKNPAYVMPSLRKTLIQVNTPYVIYYKNIPMQFYSNFQLYKMKI